MQDVAQSSQTNGQPEGGQATGLWAGPARYDAHSSWSWWASLLWVVGLLAISALVSLAATEIAAALGYGLSVIDVLRSTLAKQEPAKVDFYRMLGLGLIVQQATLVGSIWWLAGRYGGRPHQTLALLKPARTRHMIEAIVGLIVLLTPFELAGYLMAHDLYAKDIMSMSGFMKTDAWPLMVLAIVVGAPLSEEFMFRGFLLSGLAKTPVRFVGGAIIATLLWASLHLQYSLLGLSEVAIIGLYLSFVLWRSGSLWVPIACHAFNNGANVLMQAYWGTGG